MVKRLPFDVFEVKLDGSDMPATIKSLLNQGVIIEAVKFSKFITGAAAFNCSKVSSLPYWAENQAFVPLFSDRGEDVKTASPNGGRSNVASHTYFVRRSESADATVDSESTTQKLGSLDDSTTEATTCPLPGTLRRRLVKTLPKRHARVESKTYFANKQGGRYVSSGIPAQ